jgi:hypothetical protein
MSPKPDQIDGSYRARIPADVEAPDKVLYGLTFRQLAILAPAAVALISAWHLLRPLVPVPVLLCGGIAGAGVAFGLAIGRRDGLPLDVWLIHAVRFSRHPHALTTAVTPAVLPSWVAPPAGRMPLPKPLRLPADAIDTDGTITLDAGSGTAIVAATTVNLALRTSDEQTALVEAFGRWLNTLTHPTQIVVSAQPVNLHAHAEAFTRYAGRLADPALAAACADHAAFLIDLAAHRDPLHRQVLVATRTPGSGRRHAEDTARALAGLGITARTLDGAAATAAVAGCADPYRPARPGGATPSDTVITGPQMGGQHP